MCVDYCNDKYTVRVGINELEIFNTTRSNCFFFLLFRGLFYSMFLDEIERIWIKRRTN